MVSPTLSPLPPPFHRYPHHSTVTRSSLLSLRCFPHSVASPTTPLPPLSRRFPHQETSPTIQTLPPPLQVTAVDGAPREFRFGTAIKGTESFASRRTFETPYPMIIYVSISDRSKRVVFKALPPERNEILSEEASKFESPRRGKLDCKNWGTTAII